MTITQTITLFCEALGNNPGEPMTYSDVYATFKEIERKTGIHITPHLFRHTHGTIYYLETKNIKMVQERLGHSQVKQRSIYMFTLLTMKSVRIGKSDSRF